MLSYSFQNADGIIFKIQEKNEIYATREYELEVYKDQSLIYEGTVESASWGNDREAIIREIEFFDLAGKCGIELPPLKEKDLFLSNKFTVDFNDDGIIVSTEENNQKVLYCDGKNHAHFYINELKVPTTRWYDFHKLRGLLEKMMMVADREFKKL